MEDFTIKGTRPASAVSNRPSSAGRKHYGYHTLAKPSFVDESLFGSQHHSKLNEEIKAFKAPWEYPKPPPPRNTFAPPPKIKPPLKPERRGPPLFWSPSPQENLIHKRSKATCNTSNDCMWNTRDHFRHLKHTPTYVDESLFGPRLQEPTFEAPWNERKKGDKKPVRPYLFDPTGTGVAEVSIDSSQGIAVGRNNSSRETITLKSSNRGIIRPSSAPVICKGTKRKHRGAGERPPVWKP